jgi:hypothetical protein
MKRNRALNFITSPWKCWWHSPLKRWYPTTSLHGIATRKIVTWIFTAVENLKSRMERFQKKALRRTFESKSEEMLGRCSVRLIWLGWTDQKELRLDGSHRTDSRTVSWYLKTETQAVWGRGSTSDENSPSDHNCCVGIHYTFMLWSDGGLGSSALDMKR